MSKNQIATTEAERRIAERIDPEATGQLVVSNAAGGLTFANVGQVMEFSKLMAVSSHAVPNHLRGNVGACLGVVVQAIEWEMSPYAVANKSYSVNDRLAYESQLVQAVILRRAPIDGRLKVDYRGEGESRVCRVWAKLKDSDEIVEYESPPFGKIKPKNSPLWQSDPDQQHFYYSARALCRRHFPDVLLGVYARDEIEDAGVLGPDAAQDITPQPRTLSGRLDALANGGSDTEAEDVEPEDDTPAHDPETGELQEDPAEADPEPETEKKPPSKKAEPKKKAEAKPEPESEPDEDEPTVIDRATTDRLHDAYERGRLDRRDNWSRKLPTHLREQGREAEAEQYFAGWDHENEVQSADAA